MGGNTNAFTIAAFLRDKGLSPVAVAGVLGNLNVESSFDPTAYNSNEQAIGIAQWEKGRRQALQDYAKQTGSTETNLTTQMNFLWSELQARSLVTPLNMSQTPADAAALFDEKYEVSSGSTRSRRVQGANQFAASGVATGKPPPFPAGTLHAPLTSAQKATVLAYIKPNWAPGTQPTWDEFTKYSDSSIINEYNHIVSAGQVETGDPGFVTPGSGPTSLPSLSDLYGGLKTMLAFLTNIKNWERIGLFALGAILLLMAAAFIFRSAEGSVVGSVVKGAVA